MKAPPSGIAGGTRRMYRPDLGTDGADRRQAETCLPALREVRRIKARRVPRRNAVGLFFAGVKQTVCSGRDFTPPAGGAEPRPYGMVTRGICVCRAGGCGRRGVQRNKYPWSTSAPTRHRKGRTVYLSGVSRHLPGRDVRDCHRCKRWRNLGCFFACKEATPMGVGSHI